MTKLSTVDGAATIVALVKVNHELGELAENLVRAADALEDPAVRRLWTAWRTQTTVVGSPLVATEAALLAFAESVMIEKLRRAGIVL